MAVERDKVHKETNEARGGSTPNVVRWVLGISLVAVIVLLSAVWMIGAASMGPEDKNVSVSAKIHDQEDRTGDTDGVIHDNALQQGGVATQPTMQNGLEVIPNNTGGTTPSTGSAGSQ